MEVRNNTDEGFIRQAVQKVLNSIEENDYSVTRLAGELYLSREQTHRKLKKYTGLSTGQFIRYIRLLASTRYLSEGTLTVAEISYRVGFDNPGYFNKCFRREFGLPPGKIRRNSHDSRQISTAMKSFIKIPVIREIMVEQGISIKEPESILKKFDLWKTTGILALIVLVTAAAFFSTQNPKKGSTPNMTDIGRIGILPLTNRTGEMQYDQIGEITSSWLSSRLDALEDIRTVPYFTIKQYQGYAGVLPGDPEGRPTLGGVTGAGHVLTGSYFIKGDRLSFDVRLVDAHTQETVYHLPAVSGSRDSVMNVVEELRLEVAGLLLNLEKVKLGKLNPPSYDAYLYYVNGLQELGDGIKESAGEYFQHATQLDTSFVMAQIFVSWFIPPNKVDSLLQLISNIPMTDYERKVYMELYYTYQREYQKALSITLNNLRDNPYDYYLIMEAAHLAKSLFYPELALRILSNLEDPLNDDVGPVSTYFKTWNYTESLAMLGEYDSAIQYINNLPKQFDSPQILMRSMISLNADRASIEEVVRRFSKQQNFLLADNYCAAAYEYKLAGNEKDARYFSAKGIQLMKQLPGTKSFRYDLVDAYYLNDDLQKALSLIKLKLSKDPGNTGFRIYLAQVEAAMGNETEAYQATRGILDHDTAVYWRRHNYEHHSDYLMARISALLGKKEESIALVERAIKHGQLSHSWDFDYDIFLLPIFGESAFRELTAPRIYPDEIKLP